MRHRKIKAVISIAGGFLTHLVLGTFYLWGNISLYATSYFRLNGQPNLQNSTMQYVFPFIYVGIMFGQFTGVPLARRIGHRNMSGIIIIVYSVTLFLASRSNFIEFIITFGFIPGLCIGNEYLIPVDNAYFFYPERKGLVSGFILCGLGFGALVFNPMMQWLINPNNESPQQDGFYSEDVANNLPYALQTACWIYFIIGFIGVMMMVQTKIYQKMEKSLMGSGSIQLLQNINVRDDAQIKIKRWQVYLLWGIFYCNAGFGLMMASQYKTYGLTKISHDDNFFALVGSLGGVANGLSRFMWSTLLDYFSPNTLLYINISMCITLSLTFQFVASYKAGFMIWMVCIYLQYGGLFTYFPTVCTKLFGKIFGPYCYNIVNTSVMCANFTQFYINMYLQPDIGYNGVFYVYSGFGCLAMTLHLINVFLPQFQNATVRESDETNNTQDITLE